MPNAADRIRAEPRPARSAPGAARKYMRALMPTSKRSLAAAALVAMMIGIVVNAVALQHGRRIELGPEPAATAFVRPPASPVAKPLATELAPPTPPARPAPTTVAIAHPQKPGDAIGDFLRTQAPDKRKITLTAQGALAKLGFAVRPTGALDADTRSALAEFEKSRHIPVSTELTAKLVKTLTAAAAAE